MGHGPWLWVAGVETATGKLKWHVMHICVTCDVCIDCMYFIHAVIFTSYVVMFILPSCYNNERRGTR